MKTEYNATKKEIITTYSLGQAKERGAGNTQTTTLKE